jgi:hypothetical protein
LRLLQQQCLDQIPCIEAGLPGLLSTLSANLDTIYGAIRDTAHYRHRLVALTYYALDYRDLAGDAILQALNGVIAVRTRAWGGVVADGFGAFGVASNFGDSCAAGLLIPLPSGGCDIHPSPLGRGPHDRRGSGGEIGYERPDAQRSGFGFTASLRLALTVTLCSRPWLLSGWGCRGRRLSTG